MTDSRGCEHADTKVETESNRLNGVADPEGAAVHNIVVYVCTVCMFLISLTIHVKVKVKVTVDASDIVMINHVLHDYVEDMKDAIRHHSVWW